MSPVEIFFGSVGAIGTAVTMWFTVELRRKNQWDAALKAALSQQAQTDAYSPLLDRVLRIEQRMNDAEKTWSKKHGETIDVVGNLEVDVAVIWDRLKMGRRRSAHPFGRGDE